MESFYSFSILDQLPKNDVDKLVITTYEMAK